MTTTSSTEGPKPIIRLREVCRSFPMGDGMFHALRGVDLDIFPGEFVAIIGPSGSGKSTLMYILGGLDVPNSGSYALVGHELSNMPDGALSRVRNHDIGFVFQHFNLLSQLNVLENIGLGQLYGGLAKSKRTAQAEVLAARFGLDKHHAHRPGELSGGQMQRTAIARALVGGPQLILADEPTGNLDSKTGKEILDVFQQLHADGHTIVLVTHDPDVAALADREIAIVDGRIVRDTGSKASRDTRSTPDSEAKGSGSRVTMADMLGMALKAGMLAKKTRTLLTMLGIVFGIAAVIAMNGITEGGKEKQLDQIRQIGMNNIQVRDSGLAGARLLRERRVNPHGVSHRDLDVLTEQITEIDQICAWKKLAAELRHRDTIVEDASLLGVFGAFEEVANFYVAEGRFLNTRDEAEYHRVCVLGAAIADQLDAESVVGEWLLIGDEVFEVIGVMGRKTYANSDVKDVQISDRNFDVYIPHSAMRAYFRKEPFGSEFDVISMRMHGDDRLLALSAYIRRIVFELHSRAEDFEVTVPLEKIRQAQQTKEVFNIIIVVIAAISLLVGGIGIMNIMLATVTERTREIGVRRAVGASQMDILQQFLTEALLISILGGFIGLWLGVAVGELVEQIFAFPVAFNEVVMILAIVVSTIVGVVFGIYPAWMAARMNPIDALRI